MSNLINKAKEMLHSDKADNAATNDSRSTNAGPHSSNMANKVDPRVDSDRDTIGHTGAGVGAATHGATGGVGQTGYGSSGVGHGTSGVGNTHGSTTAGPHSSNMANKVDPRVDSDLDGSRNIGGGGAGYGNAGGVGHGTSGIGGAGSGIGGTHSSNTAGPHSSGMANRADPRVDSDFDGSRTMGNPGNPASGGYGSSGVGHGSSGIGGTHGSNTAGPHSSGMANRADPRVDSDFDGSRTMGNPGNPASGGYGSSGVGHGSSGIGGAHGSTTVGPHSSNMANKADPRVDSDMDGRSGLGTSGVGHSTHSGHGAGTTGLGSAGHGTHGTAGVGGVSATPGSGNTSKTAGPHNSDMMNKLDPRVDSDMDGSKTYGGNATHQ